MNYNPPYCVTHPFEVYSQNHSVLSTVLVHFIAPERNCIAVIPNVCPSIVSLQLHLKQSAFCLSLSNAPFFSSDLATIIYPLTTYIHTPSHICLGNYHSIPFFLWIPYMNEIQQCSSFCAWLVSLKIMFSRFIHIVTIDNLFSNLNHINICVLYFPYQFII